MKATAPEVYCISQPQMDWDEVARYLKSVGGDAWLDRMSQDGVHGRESKGGISDAEALVEFAGRGCYKSWDVGLNPNVTRVRTDSAEYLGNVLNVAHGSVVEHSNFTFVFQDVSRVFTHELVRHRAGVAISQESLRYVRLTDLGLRIPPILEGHTDAIVDIVERLEDFQVDMAEKFGLDDDNVPFAIKKEVTSALRRLAPMGLSTMMTWSANVRTLRFVIELRTAKSAEEEIRIVFDRVARIMKEKCPLLFQDFECNADGEWVSERWKV